MTKTKPVPDAWPFPTATPKPKATTTTITPSTTTSAATSPPAPAPTTPFEEDMAEFKADPGTEAWKGATEWLQETASPDGTPLVPPETILPAKAAEAIEALPPPPLPTPPVDVVPDPVIVPDGSELDTLLSTLQSLIESIADPVVAWGSDWLEVIIMGVGEVGVFVGTIVAVLYGLVRGVQRFRDIEITVPDRSQDTSGLPRKVILGKGKKPPPEV